MLFVVRRRLHGRVPVDAAVVVGAELYEGDVDPLTVVHTERPRRRLAAAPVRVGRTDDQRPVVSARVERHRALRRPEVGH